MNIIIAGGGEVGYYLAKLLTKESHSIVLIDNRAKVLNRADSEMDLLTIHGNSNWRHGKMNNFSGVQPLLRWL